MFRLFEDDLIMLTTNKKGGGGGKQTDYWSFFNLECSKYSILSTVEDENVIKIDEKIDLI